MHERPGRHAGSRLEGVRRTMATPSPSRPGTARPTTARADGPRRAAVRLALPGMVLAALSLAGCDNAGQDRNFERFDRNSRLLAEARLTQPADLTGLQGTARYHGTGFGVFPAETLGPDADDDDQPRSYTASADVSLTADFTQRTLSGNMTGWTPEDPGNFSMRGEVRISEGQMTRDGQFTAIVTGSVERRMTAIKRRQIEEEGEEFDLPEDFLVGIGGQVTGSVHDALSGERAAVIRGEIDAANMTGGFVAGRSR